MILQSLPAGVLGRDEALSAEKLVRTGISVGYTGVGAGDQKRLEHVFHFRAGGEITLRLHNWYRRKRRL